MANVFDVAQYILSKARPDVGDEISNLKLQKLLYYVQGFCLAINDRPMFDNDIVVWQYGPVVKEVYHACKKSGNKAIDCTSLDGDANNLTGDEQSLIDDVYDVYGQFSAGKLCDMTHQEKPWMETPINQVISQDLMRDFFKTLVVE